MIWGRAGEVDSLGGLLLEVTLRVVVWAICKGKHLKSSHHPERLVVSATLCGGADLHPSTHPGRMKLLQLDPGRRVAGMPKYWGNREHDKKFAWN